MQKNTQCRIAPSLGGGFAGTPKSAWGTTEYKDINGPAVFFGMYGLPDFLAFRNHKGKKYILWAGSDILHLKNGYWVDEEGKLKVNPKPFASYFNRFPNYCENKVEQDALRKLGIIARVIPSFLGNAKDYKVSFKPGNKVYTSVSGEDYKTYGWDLIPKLAEDNPGVEFHLYGNTHDFTNSRYDVHNIVIHGRVSQDQMNKDIKEMQGALRLTKVDGASEVIVKAMLWGQYAFSFIKYPGVHGVDKLSLLTSLKDANIKGRNWWLKNLNQYPWNTNIQK